MITDLPLFSILYQEYINGRSQLLGDYTISVKLDEHSKPIRLYNTLSENYAKIALSKLKEYWDIYLSYWINNERIPVMFESADQIYKTEYLFIDNSCIVGSNIPR